MSEEIQTTETRAPVGYVSRIASYRVMLRPTTRGIDGRIRPGAWIKFENHRYETSDPREQEAIERSVDFGRLIWREDHAPKPKEEQRDAELTLLRRENNRLSQDLARLSSQMQELLTRLQLAQDSAPRQTAQAAAPVNAIVQTELDGGEEKLDPVTLPPGQKCEEITTRGEPCKLDAVTEKDGMFVCQIHARD